MIFACTGVRFSKWVAVSYTERTQVVARINYFYRVRVDIGDDNKFGYASITQYDRFGDKQPQIVTGFEVDEDLYSSD